jgi:hypothetical protein
MIAWCRWCTRSPSWQNCSDTKREA